MIKVDEFIDYPPTEGVMNIDTFEYTIIEPPEYSEWKCYLFGNKPSGMGMVYTPTKGTVPNWFIRYMMKICLGCTWVKGE